MQLHAIWLAVFVLACCDVGWGADPQDTDARNTLNAILEQPWRLTSGSDSAATAFQFEFTVTDRTAQGASRTRRIVVERDGADCGLLMLSENRRVWGRLRDRLFLLIDPVTPEQFVLLTEGRFRFAAGMVSNGVLGYQFATSASRNLNTEVHFDLTTLIRQLLSRDPDVSRPENRTILLKSKRGALVTIRLASAERRPRFPIERITIESPNGVTLDFSNFFVDQPAPVSVLTWHDQDSADLAVECVDLPPDLKEDLVLKLWDEIRDGQPVVDAAADALTERLRKTSPRRTLE